jgi:hypothetical protein
MPKMPAAKNADHDQLPGLVMKTGEQVGYFGLFVAAHAAADAEHAGAEEGNQQMGGDLAEQRDDGNRHQDDQQQHGDTDPDTRIDQEHGPALAQPVEAGTGIDFAAFASEGRRRHGKRGVSFMRGC